MIQEPNASLKKVLISFVCVAFVRFISEANKCEKMKLHIYAFVLLLSKPYPLCPEKLKGKKKQTNEKNILREIRVANENNNF